jgi:nucleotide-binding universal stress UspA family protein
MNGTIICGLTEAPEARTAAGLAHTLSERLELRLVLVHAVDMPAIAAESVTASDALAAGSRMLAAVQRDLGSHTETRVVIGPRADALAAIAREERADMIVLGARKSGWRGAQLRCGLSGALAAKTSTPVVIASPHLNPEASRQTTPATDFAAA